MTNALTQFPRKAETLQSRLSSLNVTLKAETGFVGVYDKSGAVIGSKVVDKGITFTGNPTPQQCQEAIREIEASLAPAPERTIQAWIAELDAVTVSQKGDEASIHVKLAAYTRRMSEIPEDIAERVLVGKSWKWFPTWYEIEEITAPLIEQREMMIRKLSDYRQERTEEAIEKPEKKGGLSQEFRAMASAQAGFGDAPNVRGVLDRMKKTKGTHNQTQQNINNAGEA
jgi:hypothetical protein